MSTHAQRLGRGLRATAQVSLALTAAALSVALGAGPAAAAPSVPVPPPNPNTEPGPATPQEPAPKPEPEPAPEPAPQETGDTEQSATVEGFVWEDVDHDGIQDTGGEAARRLGAEKGVANVPVLVLVKKADAKKLPEVVRKVRSAAPGTLAAISAGLPIGFRVAVTDEAGKYSIDELPAGPARVLVLPNGAGTELDLDEQLRVTKLHQGRDRKLDSDFTPKVDNILQLVRFGVANTVLEAGKSVDLDAGVINPRTPANNGVLCINAWNDKNRNGLREKGEEPIAGLPVGLQRKAAEPKVEKRLELKLRAAKPRAEGPDDVTDAKGKFCFRELRAGTYRALIGLGPVTIDDDGAAQITKVWTLTKANVGTDDAIDSDFTLLADGSLPAEFTGKVGATEFFEVKDDRKSVVDAGMFKDEPTPAPSETPAPSPTPTTAPGDGGSGPLPTTGAALGGLLAAGGLLIGGGVAMTILGRRRRRTTA